MHQNFFLRIKNEWSKPEYLEFIKHRITEDFKN